MRYAIAVLMMVVAGNVWGQSYNCDSIGAAMTGHWKPLIEAPHDGTLVEELNTYGVAPYYSVAKFTKGRWIFVDPGFEKHSGVGGGPINEMCQWFRPFTGDLATYVDPTNGAQWTVKYECDAMRMGYDSKKDVCVRR